MSKSQSVGHSFSLQMLFVAVYIRHLLADMWKDAANICPVYSTVHVRPPSSKIIMVSISLLCLIWKKVVKTMAFC